MQPDSLLPRLTSTMLGSESDRDLIFMALTVMGGLGVDNNLRLFPNQVEAQTFLTMLGLL